MYERFCILVASWSCPAAAKKSGPTWCEVQSLAVGPKAVSTLLVIAVIAHGEVQLLAWQDDAVVDAWHRVCLEFLLPSGPSF